MLNAPNVRTLFAEAYFEAARAGAYMRTATEMLESLRALFEQNQDKYYIWRQVDKALGQVLDNEALLGAIQLLKKGFIEQVYKLETEAIRADFVKSEAEGWAHWLQTFAESLMEWKDELFVALPKENFPFAKERQSTLDLIDYALPYITQERWTESHPLFLHLAEQAIISKEVRAKLWTTAGQIQLYYFLNNEEALANFESAKALAPEHARVERSFGEYYLRDTSIEDLTKRLETARQYLKKALQLDPDDAENYHYMGDSYSEEGKNQVAAEWYRDALRRNPGNPDTYGRLITLNSKPDYFQTHSTEIPDLVAKIERLEPTRTVTAYLDAGFALQNNQQYAEAEKWFQKAVALEPQKLTGYLNLGYLYRDWNKFAEAEKAFLKAIELDAQNFDAHWELGWLHHTQENWTLALQYFEKSLPLRPEWENYIEDAISQMQQKLGQKQADEASLLESLRLNPNDTSTINALHALVDNLKATAGDAAALELLQKIQAIKGKSYDAEYHNRSGIIYYESKDYNQAIEHYKKAIATNPNDAVMLENIGLAFEAAGQAEEAEAAYHRAVTEAPNVPIPRNRLGIFYYNQQQYDKAIACYQIAIQLQPDNAIYHNNLALAQEAIGYLEEAEKSYQKATELQPNNASYYNDLGVFYHNRAKYAEAIKVYQQAITLQPDLALYHSNVAFAYEMLGNEEAALESYQKAATLDPAQAGRVAKTYFLLGQLEQTVEYARKAIAANPINGMAYDYLAQALERQGKLLEAEATLKEAIEKCVTDRDVFYNNLGLYYYNQKNYAEAVEYYNKAIKLRNNYALYYDNVGLAFEFLGKWEEAETVYQHSIELEPQNSLYLNRLGTFYYKQNQFDKAKIYYQQATDAKPDDTTSWENLGLVCEQLQQAPEAEQAFLKALENSKFEKDLYFNRLGVFCYRQGRDAEAEAYYQKAIELVPKAVYFENMGLIYERLEQSEKALASYQKAIAFSTNADRDLYLNRIGVYYNNQQRYEEAILFYRQAIELSPKSVYYENEGLALELLGKIEEAIISYKEASKLAPNEYRLYNGIGNILYRNGNAAEAIPYYQKAVELNPNIAFNYENLGLAYEQTGQLELAEAAYQKALETAFDAEKALYYNRLGVFYYTQYKTDRAIEHYQEAIKLDHSKYIFYENLGLAYEQGFRQADAEQAYLHALDLAPEKDYYHVRIGDLHLKMNALDQAQAHFEEAIAINPNKAMYYDYLAFVFEKKAIWDKALVAYERAAALEPLNPLYCDRIGNVLVAAQRTAEALPWFEKAIRLEPANDIWLSHLLQSIDILTDKYISKSILENLLQTEGVNHARIQEKLDAM